MTRTLPQLNRIVVKVGSSSLCGPDNKIQESQIIEITRQVSMLVQKGLDVVLVTSGAVAAGVGLLNEKTASLDNNQAAAAIGQPILMGYFQKYFQAYNLNTAQLLLTHDDFQSRRRYLSARNTINTLLVNQVIPIINENDSISTEEIRFSDNDQLGALCTNLVSADLYLILSNIDGIADKNPLEHADASIFEHLTLADLESLRNELIHEQVTGIGRGGIVTKLEAPRMAARYGVPSVIANSRLENVILQVVRGADIGTIIYPEAGQLNAWRAYIAHALKPKAKIIIDDGAARALKLNKASLLASGIISTQGEFKRGDGIRCCLPDGAEVMRGIVEYNQDEVQKIAGHQSGEIEGILGYRHRRSVIHRENMVTQ
ncbi:MAG: glutamate 5-kinase [Candidatus Marinimicrobia bacterium]|nr:glutamate 5-kinase [Candidatus Neomarinimicrobiota bacterium]